MHVRANKAVITPVKRVNPSHQRGSIHQPEKFVGLKLAMIFTNTRLGRAISRARVERKFKAIIGRILRLMIQNPKTPMTKSTATDWKVEKNSSNWVSLQAAEEKIFDTF